MADTPWIIQGYHRDIHPLAKHLWLTGPWIETFSVAEQGKYYRQFFRPLASWDLWLAVRVGLAHGFVWVSRSTLVLFMGTCLLCATLAWRLTRSELCTLGAAVLCCDLRFIDTDTPPYWMAWFPVRQDLYHAVISDGGADRLDMWRETGQEKPLWAGRVCVLLGCLTKEYDYVLALMVPLLLLNERGQADLGRFGPKASAGGRGDGRPCPEHCGLPPGRPAAPEPPAIQVVELDDPPAVRPRPPVLPLRQRRGILDGVPGPGPLFRQRPLIRAWRSVGPGSAAAGSGWVWRVPNRPFFWRTCW